MTASLVFSCQPYFETIVHKIFQTLSSCNRNEPKQSTSISQQITQGSNSAEQKVTKSKTANAQFSQTVFTHNLALSSSFWLLGQYLLPLLQLQFFKLFNLVSHYDLKS